MQHHYALRSLRREHQHLVEREKQLGDILNPLRSGYNPNYQDMAVLETIESWLPWLEEVSAIPGSTCPAWCLRRLINKVREESGRGRHLLAFFLGIEPSSDWTDIHSSGSSEKYEKMLVVGRVMETGLPFHEITGF